MKNTLFSMVILLGLSAGLAGAQVTPPPGAAGDGNPPRKPKPPIFAAIDANQDGVLGADEIAQAATALKTLDKNGDGQLTRAEYIPPRPGMSGAAGADGSRGPGGDGLRGAGGGGRRAPGMEGARDPESPGPGGPGETVAPAPGGEGLGRPGEDASPGSVGRRQRPPRPPIDLALDANQDGILSADEIANAPGALKTLDKNGDGRLTRDECLPPRPSNPVGEPALK